MKRKVISRIMLTLLLLGVLPLAIEIRSVRAEPATWTVDDDGPADFSKIQDAINAASTGDTIHVFNGTYYENIIVNKTVSLVGENRSITTIDAKGKGTVITVTADRVSIKNFTIQNSEFTLNVCFGILIGRSKNSIISGNTIKKNSFGIYLSISNDNTINHNIVIDNGVGIELLDSSNNVVNGNMVTSNYVGISLSESGGNVLRNNSMVGNLYNFGVVGDVLPHFVNDIDTSNTVNGKVIYYLINKQNLVIDHSVYLNAGYLAVINSTNIKVQDLSFSNNKQGVLFAYTSDSGIENVNVSDNFQGIMLFGSNNTLKGNNLAKNGYGIESEGHNNIYFKNMITNNNDGIWLMGSNNSINKNVIVNNTYRGIYLIGLNNSVHQNEIMNNPVGIVIDFYNNKIYHNNFIDNLKQADLNLPRAIGIWDDGYPSGGNYWSDYEEKYPDAEEIDDSGIWNTAYIIDERNQDNYPLMEPWSSKPSSPVEATQELIETIKIWNLPKGVENSLASKLDNVIHMLDKADQKGATHKLMAFLNQVKALEGKKVTIAQAEYLVAEARRIISLIKG